MSEPLRLAVPRGVLFEQTLDLLAAIGLDSEPLRSDSRSLLFPGQHVTVLRQMAGQSPVPRAFETGQA